MAVQKPTTQGRWVTIRGARVFIGAGGQIEKGPASLVDQQPDAQTAWASSLSEDQRLAVDTWMTSFEGCEAIRRCQETGEGTPRDRRKTAEFEEALDAAPPYSGECFRGQTLEVKDDGAATREAVFGSMATQVARSFPVGTELEYKASASTSENREVAERFLRGRPGDPRDTWPVMLRMAHKNAASLAGAESGSMASQMESLREVVIRKGSRYRVTSSPELKRRPGGEYYHEITLEEV